MNFKVDDVVIFKHQGITSYGVVEEISNDTIGVKGNVRVRDLTKQWVVNVWGINVDKLTEETYNNRRNELLQQLDELDAAFELVKQK